MWGKLYELTFFRFCLIFLRNSRNLRHFLSWRLREADSTNFEGVSRYHYSVLFFHIHTPFLWMFFEEGKSCCLSFFNGSGNCQGFFERGVCVSSIGLIAGQSGRVSKASKIPTYSFVVCCLAYTHTYVKRVWWAGLALLLFSQVPAGQ